LQTYTSYGTIASVKLKPPAEPTPIKEQDYHDIWREASAEAIFKALIPGWKAAEK